MDLKIKPAWATKATTLADIVKRRIKEIEDQQNKLAAQTKQSEQLELPLFLPSANNSK